MVEGLGDRRLLSVSPALGFRLGGSDLGAGHGIHARGASIEFSQAPTAVQNGIKSLATAQRLTAPTDTTSVFLGNSNGVETYTVLLSTTGTTPTTTRLTVDVSGNAVTAPTRSTTTFGAINNAAVTNRINAIATALGLTAPTADTTVNVVTPATGPAVYSVRLSPSDSSETEGEFHHRGTTITVDANGNPVGNQRLPLSTLPTAVQNGLTSNVPAGATALTPTSIVTVRTLNGVTTYSATYTGTGTQTVVTVNTAGQLAALPSRSQVTFSTLPAAARNELQELATADGVTGTIAGTQTVTAYNEGNGTTVYSVRLIAAATRDDGSTYMYPVTLSVDQNGNATVPPTGGFFNGSVFRGRGFGPGDFHFGGAPGGFGGRRGR